ncbi:hypothetical protein AZE42_12152 [Rhizopogon vesiculosus]|uniref:Methyltransferase type 11 domain-containing protein n=1 Tax=Rhizopogon vesiculosus TaxID=180088 RepID=A0A1J8PVY5_9AGAM|nr:hypothetical protein AZE42_12152 [Rhizopogon vesiculosus]
MAPLWQSGVRPGCSSNHRHSPAFSCPMCGVSVIVAWMKAVNIRKALGAPHEHDIVLDIGAGHDHTIKHLEHSRVTKYFAIEPNVHMHAERRRAASAAGYSEDADTLLIQRCRRYFYLLFLPSRAKPALDTLIFILTIRSISSPRPTIYTLITEELKPGGQVLFYEHHRSVAYRSHVPYISPRKEVSDDAPWFSGLFGHRLATYLEVYLQDDEAECDSLKEIPVNGAVS